MIHLPESSKNLISIAQWSKDRKDDCKIFSRGEHSILMWDNDSKMRLIHHNSTCYIPLLPINESDIDFINFLQIYSKDLIVNVCLLQNRVHIQDDSEEATKTDKQFLDVDSQPRNQEAIPVGTIVRSQIGKNNIICVITKEY